MCAGSDNQGGLVGLLRDPLIRLVMNSDGVTEQDMIDLMDQLHRSLAARESERRSVPERQAALNRRRASDVPRRSRVTDCGPSTPCVQ